MFGKHPVRSLPGPRVGASGDPHPSHHKKILGCMPGIFCPLRLTIKSKIANLSLGEEMKLTSSFDFTSPWNWSTFAHCSRRYNKRATVSLESDRTDPKKPLRLSGEASKDELELLAFELKQYLRNPPHGPRGSIAPFKHSVAVTNLRFTVLRKKKQRVRRVKRTKQELELMLTSMSDVRRLFTEIEDLYQWITGFPLKI
jgi:hypothetical protein